MLSPQRARQTMCSSGRLRPPLLTQVEPSLPSGVQTAGSAFTQPFNILSMAERLGLPS